MWVALSDGRTLIGAPLAWFPRLLAASAADRAAVELSAFGLHWPTLDEDVSVEGLLAGRGDGTARRGWRRRWGDSGAPVWKCGGPTVGAYSHH